MYIYYILFFVLAAFSFVEKFCSISKNKKKIIIYIFSALFVLLSAFYYGAAGDYHAYERTFQNSSINSVTIIEPLYSLINFAIRSFTNQYWILRLALAVIVMSLWAKVITRFENSFIEKNALTILFVLWALKQGNIFVIRSTIAVAICAYSLRYIEERKLWQFVVCSLTAFGFHMMTIVWFPAYFIFNKRKMRGIYYLGILLCFIFPSLVQNTIISLIPLVPSVYLKTKLTTYFINRAGWNGGNAYSTAFLTLKGSANMIIMVIFFIVVISRTKKCKQIISGNDYLNLNIERYEYYYNIYLIGALMYVISMITTIAVARAALPYTSMQFIILPGILDLPDFKRRIIDKFVVWALFVSYIFLRMYVSINDGAHTFTTIFM